MKERIFVVSDLHGVKSVYDGITNYLDELALCNPETNIRLLINGDIIDRGPAPIEMLQDVMARHNQEKGYFSVDMLAGNHELMMYEAIQMGYNSYWAYKNLSWYHSSNGGNVTSYYYSKLAQPEQKKIVSFLDNLELQKTYQKEMLDTKGVIVVHAHASGMMKFFSEQFNIKSQLKDIKDDIYDYYTTYNKMSNKYLEYIHTLWDRKTKKENMGLKEYLTIVGHTPVTNSLGYYYDNDYKVLNIDGGCAPYAFGIVNEVTVPLVELDFKNKEVIINRFNVEGKQLETHLLTKDGIKKGNNKILKI